MALPGLKKITDYELKHSDLRYALFGRLYDFGLQQEDFTLMDNLAVLQLCVLLGKSASFLAS